MRDGLADVVEQGGGDDGLGGPVAQVLDDPAGDGDGVATVDPGHAGPEALLGLGQLLTGPGVVAGLGAEREERGEEPPHQVQQALHPLACSMQKRLAGMASRRASGIGFWHFSHSP